MEEIFSIVDNDNSAMILCLIALWYMGRKQDKINSLLQEEIKDGIKKSHEQHVEIIQLCKDNDTNLNNKSKSLNQKIDLVMKLRKENEGDSD